MADPFREDAKASNNEEGLNLRTVFTQMPIDQKGAEALEKAEPMIDGIIHGLTSPLTEIEESPKPKEVEKLSRIAFKGNLKEVNQFFMINLSLFVSLMNTRSPGRVRGDWLNHHNLPKRFSRLAGCARWPVSFQHH